MQPPSEQDDKTIQHVQESKDEKGQRNPNPLKIKPKTRLSLLSPPHPCQAFQSSPFINLTTSPQKY
jgi:hypothetical protein